MVTPAPEMPQSLCPEIPSPGVRGVLQRTGRSTVPRVISHLRGPLSAGLRSSAASGFTLLELMIAAAIVGLLSVIAIAQCHRAMAATEASRSILERVAFAE